MTDAQEPNGESNEHAADAYLPADLDVNWREIPTTFVDQVVAFASADGVLRLSLGELAFNPDGPLPQAKPVLTIASTIAGWKRIIGSALHAIDQLETGSELASNE